MARNLEQGSTYPDATGQPEVLSAVARFRALPEEERQKQPLLYWLLRGSAPAFKMSPTDSEYDESGEHDGRKCGNCRFMFERVVSGEKICSQISIHIVSFGFCRLWRGA